MHDKLNKNLVLENEHLTLNENIKVNDKVISCKQLDNVRIKDILHPDRSIFTALELSEKFEINIMLANSVLSSIPYEWKSRLKRRIICLVNHLICCLKAVN